MGIAQRLTIKRNILEDYPLPAWGGIILLGLINAALGVWNHHSLHTPLFFDTIGTLVSAAAFGIFPGVVTAVSTHLFMGVLDGFIAVKLLWTLVSVSSAVIMGSMAQRGMFTQPMHIAVAVVLITLVNALLGAGIAAFAYAGATDHPVDYLASSFMAIGQNVISASFWARLPINVIDKGIAVAIAFAAKRLWFDRLQSDAAEKTARQSEKEDV